MQIEAKLTPDYIFETSWEVCNKVGGIYTVLSTRANTLQRLYEDRVLFIGPDLQGDENPWFIEEPDLYKSWREHARANRGLKVRAGRWDVPGSPIALLVQFEPFLQWKNNIYAQMWTDFGVDSISAYGDYHESTVFAYTAGMLIESFYRFHHLETENVIAHFNEWMTGAGALYIKKHVPKVATIFTTHATSIGRSIASNNLPLYTHLEAYDGDQMASMLNMAAKHSIEKKAALNVDCLTTVSDITARECVQFLGRQPDVVTPNGFEKGFIPTGKAYDEARARARHTLLNVAEKVLGHPVDRNALLVGTSGRYEYKNKGIDLFIDAMKRLQSMEGMEREVIAFIMVPAWIKGPRETLQETLEEGKNLTGADAVTEAVAPSSKTIQPGQDEPFPFTTHELVDPWHDAVTNHIKRQGFSYAPGSRVKILFVPSYLNGDDGIFNLPYYDLLIGFDLSLFPSYYEPWGYTPHESVAFSIPTITTSLSGFGAWAGKQGQRKSLFHNGVEVIHRDDENYEEAMKTIASVIRDFSLKNTTRVTTLKRKAAELSNQADWAHFIVHYQEAYRKALHHSFLRLSRPCKPNVR
ncbi:MAG: glycogen/starch synthase [Fermentimonas sp.]|jgi:glycosyltransferase involved in cell wall biosynthesis